MLIQFHLLQSYGPSNLNRDDTGAPKDAYLGGVRRARISSQCVKRSIRKSDVFEAGFANEGLLATRTRKWPEKIQDAIIGLGEDEQTAGAIAARLPELARKADKPGRKDDDEPDTAEDGNDESVAASKQLVFLAQNEIDPLATKLIAVYHELGGSEAWREYDVSALLRKLGKSVPRSVDVAMFGRMTTSSAFENVSAAVQVAHALSVNTLQEEFDYYTAVDDLSGESGAGMIGDVEFNSSTYYKYFNVHWEQLLQNLGGDAQIAQRAVLALLEAAATAQPSGKQNSFAMHCLPDAILVEVRAKNLPVNYANAFLKPARQTADRTLVEDALAKLADYQGKVTKAYGLEAERAYISLYAQPLPGERQDSLAELQAWLERQLPEG
jgi:CRISPR system Cascade subunit CasC